MKRKKKASEISIAKWQSEFGAAWKHVVHWLSIRELANYRAISKSAQRISADEDKGRVPWKIIPKLIKADMSNGIWSSAESNPEFACTYMRRWMIQHCSPFKPDSPFVAGTLQPAMVLIQPVPFSDLFARLKDQTFFIFMVGPDYNTTMFKTGTEYAHLCCKTCERCGIACCYQSCSFPSLKNWSMGGVRSRAGCTTKCADWGPQEIGVFNGHGVSAVKAVADAAECEIDPTSGLPCYRNPKTKELCFPECNLLGPRSVEPGGLPSPNWGEVESPYTSTRGRFKVTLQGICEGKKPFNLERVTISDFKALEEPKKKK